MKEQTGLIITCTALLLSSCGVSGESEGGDGSTKRKARADTTNHKSF